MEGEPIATDADYDYAGRTSNDRGGVGGERYYSYTEIQPLLLTVIR